MKSMSLTIQRMTTCLFTHSLVMGSVFSGLFLLLFMVMPAVASEDYQGRNLYEEHCVACHDSTVYTRKDRIVHSFSELKERIRQCELSNELAWFDEEVEDVATYLNNNFYHFETR